MSNSKRAKLYIEGYTEKRLKPKGVWSKDVIFCVLCCMENRSPDLFDADLFSEYVELVKLALEYFKECPNEKQNKDLRLRVEEDAESYIRMRRIGTRRWKIRHEEVQSLLELVRSEMTLR